MTRRRVSSKVNLERKAMKPADAYGVLERHRGGFASVLDRDMVVIPRHQFLKFCRALRDLPLETRDNGFICVPEHALEVARMISDVEGIVMRSKDKWTALSESVELLKQYVDGDMTATEVVEEFRQPEWQEDIRDEYKPRRKRAVASR